MSLSANPYITLTVSSISDLAPGFKRISFEEGHLINYQAGQYLTLVDNSHNTEIRRSYSILSIPHANEELAIGVKRIENGYFSRKLVDDIRPGDQLLTSGVGGFFRLPENTDKVKHLVMFAAGSGITPIYSLIRSALINLPLVKVTLFYSSSSISSTALYQSLNELIKLFGNRFHINYLFSDHKKLSEARLTRERIISFVSSIEENLRDVFFFTCGPETYMMKVIFVLQEFGIVKDQIRKEEFVTRRNSGSLYSPPDKTTRKATIHIHHETYSFLIHHPYSILAAAKMNGLLLPYSCETGKCGNCAAICLKGKVWLSNNEVLMDEDLKKGLTLTCVGHPAGGDIELDFPTS